MSKKNAITIKCMPLLTELAKERLNEARKKLGITIQETASEIIPERGYEYASRYYRAKTNILIDEFVGYMEKAAKTKKRRTDKEIELICGELKENLYKLSFIRKEIIGNDDENSHKLILKIDSKWLESETIDYSKENIVLTELDLSFEDIIKLIVERIINDAAAEKAEILSESIDVFMTLYGLDYFSNHKSANHNLGIHKLSHAFIKVYKELEDKTKATIKNYMYEVQTDIKTVANAYECLSMAQRFLTSYHCCGAHTDKSVDNKLISENVTNRLKKYGEMEVELFLIHHIDETIKFNADDYLALSLFYLICSSKNYMEAFLTFLEVCLKGDDGEDYIDQIWDMREIMVDWQGQYR